MVCLRGLDRKSYSERLAGGWLPELSCPDPECEDEPLRGHGWYRRYLDQILMAIRRLRCRRCRVTHALLPEDVVAYRDLTLAALESALQIDAGPSVRAQAAGQEGVCGVRRVRGWRRRLSSGWVHQLVAILPASAGDLWERVVASLGPPPGALVRLRHWLWSTYRLFFSGLSGLYRHGRPGWDPREPST